MVLASVRQHLARMQQRMKYQADKHRTEREFAVGDEVFLRLQPYIQKSIARRVNQKLTFKFFGPFRVLERIGAVAYKLDLPPASRVHPVFHVSQLKLCIGPRTLVSPTLPAPDAMFKVPAQVLHRRVRQRGNRSFTQVLVQWSSEMASDATWENLEQLRQSFPHAPAWGQAGFEGEGIVSDPSPPVIDCDPVEQAQGPSTPGGRPKRKKRPSPWLDSNVWST